MIEFMCLIDLLSNSLLWRPGLLYSRGVQVAAWGPNVAPRLILCGPSITIKNLHKFCLPARVTDPGGEFLFLINRKWLQTN